MLARLFKKDRSIINLTLNKAILWIFWPGCQHPVQNRRHSWLTQSQKFKTAHQWLSRDISS
ncbi:hypothetical protein PR048_000924 [Dryococelus australis]|uniref:Uncharacterized protein n=1 Tax=Dryococelus australis TaxID=614101 RepID=A0ABQ9IFX9_9NEOP|nr:hypothetical protein PR048_000924 [Dryococelus australis]